MLSRNSSVASSETKEISVVQSDYTFDSLVNAFQGQDAVISAIPIIDFEHQRKVIDAAAAAKVKRYLPNEFGVDTSVEATSHFAAFFKIKQDIVAYLKEKEHLGLSWTALCTGPWVDWVSTGLTDLLPPIKLSSPIYRFILTEFAFFYRCCWKVRAFLV